MISDKPDQYTIKYLRFEASYKCNVLHCEDGPAIKYNDGGCWWFIDGTEYTFDEWCEKLNLSDEDKTVLYLKHF